MTEAETAWLAGLYEGEGSLHRVGPNGWRLAIVMQDEDIIRRAHALADAGKVVPEGRYWRWNVGRRGELAELVPLLLPYLGERRTARAREFLGFVASLAA